MARTESTVRDLVEDEGMREAVETVLEAAEAGTVRWVDVRDDISSGQWGRLIERGVLVDGDEGFELADAEATAEALEPEDDEADDDTDDVSWSTADKVAGVLSVGLFAGYLYEPVQNVIGGTIDLFLAPVSGVLPFYVVILLLALLTGLYSTLLQSLLTDSEKMGEFQEKTQALQEKRKAAKEAGDTEEMKRLQEEQMEAMGDQMGMMKMQFRPMVWIMFLTIPAFLWMYWKIGVGDPNADAFGQSVVLPLAGQVNWKDPVAGPMQAWIVWYFLCSMSFTQVLRKGLNIDISPTSS
jgi:uncharacterized membrane protein (DUF106 family)